MPYIDEFVAAVPTDKGDTYLAHTKRPGLTNPHERPPGPR